MTNCYTNRKKREKLSGILKDKSFANHEIPGTLSEANVVVSSAGRATRRCADFSSPNTVLTAEGRFRCDKENALATEWRCIRRSAAARRP